jgi:hypothetical protein
MTYHGTFDITTPEDYYREIVLPTYKDSFTNPNKCRSAPSLMAITFAYHLLDWKFADVIEDGKRKKVKDGYAMIQHILGDKATSEEILYFAVARKIANGTKHFGKPGDDPNKDRARTELVNPWSKEFTTEFGPTPIISVPKTDGTGDKIVSARQFLDVLMGFWDRYMN